MDIQNHGDPGQRQHESDIGFAANFGLCSRRSLPAREDLLDEVTEQGNGAKDAVPLGEVGLGCRPLFSIF